MTVIVLRQLIERQVQEMIFSLSDLSRPDLLVTEVYVPVLPIEISKVAKKLGQGISILISRIPIVEAEQTLQASQILGDGLSAQRTPKQVIRESGRCRSSVVSEIHPLRELPPGSEWIQCLRHLPELEQVLVQDLKKTVAENSEHHVLLDRRSFPETVGRSFDGGKGSLIDSAVRLENVIIFTLLLEHLPLFPAPFFKAATEKHDIRANGAGTDLVFGLKLSNAALSCQMGEALDSSQQVLQRRLPEFRRMGKLIRRLN